jgi:hypothetical protein
MWGAVTPEALGSETETIQARVLRVDLEDPRNPRIVVLYALPQPPSATKKPTTLNVHFTTGPGGCINWSDPANRSKAIVFGLAPEDFIRVEIKDEQGEFQVEKLQLMAAATETTFQGQEKIKDPSLINALHTPPKVRVIVLLKGHETLKSQIADPKSRDQARAEIKRLQEEVLKSLPAGTFEPKLKLENVPTFSGEATFSALIALAAHPMVVAIEKDRPMELHPPETRMITNATVTLSGTARDVATGVMDTVSMTITTTDGRSIRVQGATGSVRLFGRFEGFGQLANCQGQGQYCYTTQGTLYLGDDGSGFPSGTQTGFSMNIAIANNFVRTAYTTGMISVDMDTNYDGIPDYPMTYPPAQGMMELMVTNLSMN